MSPASLEKTGPYRLIRPCAHCPFRNDIPGYLREARVYEIEDGLVRGSFPCHETTAPEGDDGERPETGDEGHCAGALILLEKLERPSQLMRIAERIGLYDRRKLDMDAPVYDTFEEMADAHAAADNRRRRRRK